MVDIKLSVTIELPGSTMMTPQECGENPNNYTKNHIMLSTKHFDKKTKKTYFKKEPLEFSTRKCKPAYQVIKMSSDAFDYMTSSSCPDWYNNKIMQNWKSLTAITRLELHLERLCASLGGISYTYMIAGD